MSPDAQRVAIAEACGWTLDHIRRGAMYYVPSIDAHVGDPLHDLNAMHEAEATIRKDYDTWGVYLHWLGYAAPECRVFSTAAQRAEAFLRTIGKWEDGK